MQASVDDLNDQTDIIEDASMAKVASSKKPSRCHIFGVIVKPVLSKCLDGTFLPLLFFFFAHSSDGCPSE